MSGEHSGESENPKTKALSLSFVSFSETSQKERILNRMRLIQWQCTLALSLEEREQ